MYVPPAFRNDDTRSLQEMIRAARLANLVTATADGPWVTPLPLLLDDSEGEHGVLHGHIAKANRHWLQAQLGNSVAIFMGPDAYVTPSWYATKRETGKVVPTWNYMTVHACGPLEFYHDADRLLATVTRLTRLHEEQRPSPWAVSDAPSDYIAAQLKGIVGVRMTITRLEGKTKMSQNRTADDRHGVAEGLAASEDGTDRAVAGMVRGALR